MILAGRNFKGGRAAELDRFWDIDALLPTRRVPARSRNTEAEEVTVAAKTPDATDAANPPLYHAEPLPPPAKDQENTVVHPHEAPLLGTSVRRSVFPAPPPAPAPILEYEPDSALLHRVSVYLPRSTHTYYDAFCRTAQALAKRRGSPAQPIPFFSYVPQYDQMTRANSTGIFACGTASVKGSAPQPTTAICSFLRLKSSTLRSTATRPRGKQPWFASGRTTARLTRSFRGICLNGSATTA